MKFSAEQKVFIVCVYRTKSYKNVQEEFFAKYSDWNTLLNCSIKRVVDKFERTGSIMEL